MLSALDIAVRRHGAAYAAVLTTCDGQVQGVGGGEARVWMADAGLHAGLLQVVRTVAVNAELHLVICPGRNPPFWAVERPLRPYKSVLQKRFTIENVKGAEPSRAGPDRRSRPRSPLCRCRRCTRFVCTRRTP